MHLTFIDCAAVPILPVWHKTCQPIFTKELVQGFPPGLVIKHQAVLASCCGEGEEEVGQPLHPSFPTDSRADQLCRTTCTPAESTASEK